MSRALGWRLLFAIALSVSCWADAQQTATMYRIGCIPGGPMEPRKHQWDAFRQGLRELGWIEGRNVSLEFRTPAREGAAFDDLAADLVRLKVDVIVASGSPAVVAIKRATSTISVVMTGSGDPVGLGLVNSLARPGGNVTGMSLMQIDLAPKRLEMLREIVPGVSRIAVLWGSPLEQELRKVQAAAKGLSLEIVELKVSEAAELDKAFHTARERRAGAMMVLPTTLIFGMRARIAELAIQSRLPAFSGYSSFAQAGGLAAYGPSETENYRRAAVYVDKILKGAKPADLPVEQPSEFSLVVNLRTAKALSLTIPPSVLLRADRVID